MPRPELPRRGEAPERNASVGARGVWQKLEAKGGSGAVSANAFGIFLGAEL